MKATDLSALIASRLCHDLVSPVGAISNGLEIIADEKDPDIIRQAVELLNMSVRQAEYKLTFYRLAFGASATAGGEIASRDVTTAATNYLREEKVAFNWTGEPVQLSKMHTRILANLILFGRDCLPRGGALAATGTSEGFTIIADGQNCRIRDEALQLLEEDGRAPMPHLAPIVLLKTLTGEANARIEAQPVDERIRLRVLF